MKLFSVPISEIATKQLEHPQMLSNWISRTEMTKTACAYILVVLGRVLNVWCDLHIYKAHLFSLDACTRRSWPRAEFMV